MIDSKHTLLPIATGTKIQAELRLSDLIDAASTYSTSDPGPDPMYDPDPIPFYSISW